MSTKGSNEIRRGTRVTHPSHGNLVGVVWRIESVGKGRARKMATVSFPRPGVAVIDGITAEGERIQLPARELESSYLFDRVYVERAELRVVLAISVLVSETESGYLARFIAHHGGAQQAEELESLHQSLLCNFKAVLRGKIADLRREGHEVIER